MSKIKSLLDHQQASLFIFILWPFMGFLLAIRNYHQLISKIVILLFFSLYGFILAIETGGGDLNANYTKFTQYALESNSFFWVLINGLFKQDGSLDLIQRLIMFFVSRFTANVNVLFLVYAFIFGFLYLKGINKLHHFHSKKKNINALLMLLFFLLIIPITNIGNFRFFSAVYIYFIGAYHVIYFKNYKYFSIAILSVLMHFGLLGANIILILYVIIGNKNNLYIVFVILSLIIPQFSGDYIIQFSNKLGGAFEDKAADYLNADYVESIAAQKLIWFIELRPKILLYYVYLMYIVSYFFWPKQKNEGFNNIFSFSLLFLSFTNFVSEVPSLGIRYLGIFNLFAFLYLFYANWYYYYYNPKNRLSTYSYLGIIPLILQVIMTFRMAFETINVWLLAPMPLPFIGSPKSIWSFIGG